MGPQDNEPSHSLSNHPPSVRLTPTHSAQAAYRAHHTPLHTQHTPHTSRTALPRAHGAPPAHTGCVLAAVSVTTRQALPPALGALRPRPPQDRARNSSFLLPGSPQALHLSVSPSLALPGPTQVTRVLPTSLLCGPLRGFADHCPAWPGTHWLRQITLSRMSSKPLTPHLLEGKAKKQSLCLPSPSLERENVRFSVSVAAAGGLEGE